MWDQIQDPYDHTQAANNFAKLDAHDHTPGRGVQLTTQSIEGEAITTALLSSESITTAKLAKESVTGEKIGAGGVKYEEGIFASRPSAGKKGRIYYATDTKLYSVDTGAAWNELQPKLAAGESYSLLKTVSKAEAETGFTPSATRAAFVEVMSVAGSLSGEITVNGKRVAAPAGKSGCSFIVPPGGTWKGTGLLEEVTTLIL
jgi:hypothetical protein